MIKPLNINEDVTAVQIVDLQHNSYRVEANIIGTDKIPPLNDTIDTVKMCNESFYGYYVDDSLAGLIAYKIEDNVLDICRVAVHPSYFRRGIAKKLILYVFDHNDYNSVVVATGSMNEPAKKLYIGLGFKEVGEREVEEGISITLFEKMK